jgi:hypothetical protein
VVVSGISNHPVEALTMLDRSVVCNGILAVNCHPVPALALLIAVVIFPRSFGTSGIYGNFWR